MWHDTHGILLALEELDGHRMVLWRGMGGELPPNGQLL